MLKKAFIFLVILLPWQIALNLGEGIDLSLGRVLIALLFLAFIAGMFLRKKVDIPLQLPLFFLLSFLFLMALSAFFSNNLEWSFRKIIFLFSFFPIYLLAEFFLRDGEKARVRLLGTILFSSFTVALLGIVQFFIQFLVGSRAVYEFWAKNLAPIFLGRAFSEAVLTNSSWLVNISGRTWLRATSVFPDPHMFSFFLNLSLGAGLALAIERPRKIMPWIALGVLILADWLTFSRGGYLGLAVAFIFLFVWLIFRLDASKKVAFSSLFVILVSVLLLSSPVRERFASSFDFREGSNVGRIETWEKAWEGVREHPLSGMGIGNYPTFVKPNADYREPIYAHNIYLDILLDGGIGALFFWLMLLGFSVVNSVRKVKKEPWRMGMVFGLVSFSIHGFFDTPLYSVSVFPLLLIMLYIANYGFKKDKK